MEEWWLALLACPDCHVGFARSELHEGRFYCSRCGVGFGSTDFPLPLRPNGVRGDSRYWFEDRRYQRVAEIGPEDYRGYVESRPSFRAEHVISLMEEFKPTLALNVGPGFGEIEARWEGPIFSLDPNLAFLEKTALRNPLARPIHGVAEYLPFRDAVLDCLMADCVFQSVVDRERFLYEATRALRLGGLMLLGIAYRWNYPSRFQQGFNVLRADEERGLYLFLKRLGFEVAAEYWDLENLVRTYPKEDGDYLWIKATKTC